MNRKLSIIQALSGLVASGNGTKCNEVIATIRLSTGIDQSSGLSQSWIMKNGREKYLKSFYQITEEMFYAVTPKLEGIDDRFFTKSKLDKTALSKLN